MRLEGVDRTVIINPFKKPHLENKLVESLQLDSSHITYKSKEILTGTENNTQRLTLSQEELNRMMEEIRHKFSLLEKYLQIDIDRELQIPISKIIDMTTEEVIRQIPPEWIIEILRRMEELKGLFYYEEV